MLIEFACPSCNHTLRMGGDTAGKVVRCGGCMAKMRVPNPQAAPPPPPPPPVEPAHVLSLDDDEDDEPAPRRRPRRRKRAKPRSRLLIPLLVFSALSLVAVVGGGLYFGLRPSWRTHESAGGFKVDLPAAPRDMTAQTGFEQANVPLTIEGTRSRLGAEEYFIAYGELEPRRRNTSHEIIFNDAVNGMIGSLPGGKVVRSDRVEVSGFPAREVVVSDGGKRVAVARIVIAESRLFLLLAGGSGGDQDNPRFRRFVESFEITDPVLVAAGQRRRDAAEAARRTTERLAAEAKKREDDRLAAEKKREDDRLAAERLREQERLERERKAAELERQRREAEDTARRAADVFRTAQWTGPPVPDPAALPGLVLYLPFDDVADEETSALPSGRKVKTAPHASAGAGVRGAALYLPRQWGFALPEDLLPPGFTNRPAYSAAAWVRMRSGYVVPFWAKAPSMYSPFGTYLSADDRQAGGYDGRGAGGGARPNLQGSWKFDQHWHHLAIVRTGNDKFCTFALYLDGVRIDEQTHPPIPEKSAQLWLGLTGPEAERPKPGGPVLTDLPFAAIDEVCLFDQALTDRGVQYLAGRDPLAPGARAFRPPVAPGAELVPLAVAPEPRRAYGAPAATEFAGLRFYLACDEVGEGGVREAVSGKFVGKLVDDAKLIDGVRGKALRLTANSPRVEYVSGLALDPAAVKVAAGRPFTLSYWGREIPGAKDFPAVFFQATGGLVGNQSARFLVNRMEQGKFFALVSERVPGDRLVKQVSSVLPPAGPAFEWNHFAMVRDGAGVLTFWVNGRPAGSGPFDGELAYDHFGLVTTQYGRVVADVDEFALFDRTLTSDEVVKLAGNPPAAVAAARLASAGVPPATDFPHLRFYLACDAIENGALKEAVTGRFVGTFGGPPEVVAGARGKAIRLSTTAKRGEDPGKPGLALDPLALRVDADKPFTLSYWAKREILGQGIVLTNTTTRARAEPGFVTFSTTLFDDSWNVRAYGTRPDGRPEGNNRTGGTLNPQRGWNHYAVVRGKDGTLLGWVNGKPVDPGWTFTAEMKYEVFHFVAPGSLTPQVVDIDEFALFDAALGEADIKLLAGRAGK